MKGTRVLLPTQRPRGQRYCRPRCERAGAEVTEVVAYRTESAERGGCWRARIAAGRSGRDDAGQPVGVSRAGRFVGRGDVARHFASRPPWRRWGRRLPRRFAQPDCTVAWKRRSTSGGIWRRRYSGIYASSSSRQRERRMTFPIHRPRRLRRTEAIRGMVRETRAEHARAGLSHVRRARGAERAQGSRARCREFTSSRWTRLWRSAAKWRRWEFRR